MSRNFNEFKEKFNLLDFCCDHFEIHSNSNRIYIECPFHQENTASCMIEKDRWYCFGSCGAGGDSIDFLSRLTGKTPREIIKTDEYLQIKHIERRIPREKRRNTLSISMVQSYHKSLMRKPSKLSYLYDRHFDKESVIKSRIGYGVPSDLFGYFKRPRYVIPHFDLSGALIGIRYRLDPKYNDEDKYIAHPGTKGVLYNIGLLEKFNNIIYCGSQLDAAVLYCRFGIHAIAPPSENTFNTKWTPLFKDKKVLIWLDNDTTGRNSSLKVYRNIKNICDAQIYIWPTEFKQKDDTKDFLDKYGINGVKDVMLQYGINS